MIAWGGKLGSKLFFLGHFLKVASLVFLDIAQDCSLGQCLTYNRAETSRKNLWPKMGPKIFFLF